GNDTINTASTKASANVVAKATELGKSAQGNVAAMIALEEPKLMPAHQFVDPNGDVQSIDMFKGKITLVNLWATWCAPCREEMPALSELQTAKQGADFEVVTINIDRGDRNKPEGFLNEIGVDNLPLYQDSTMGVFNALKKEGLAFGLPVTMLLDENGYILASMNGPAHWSSPDALNYIDAAIATKQTNVSVLN
ncbi:MAG: TlpA disulfide reductase family protein, partial [Lentilitoribacter sp.]